MHGIQPQRLSDDELTTYAQMYLDRKEVLPQEWAQELLTRFGRLIDAGTTLSNALR
jgi:hypothetical protein